MVAVRLALSLCAALALLAGCSEEPGDSAPAPQASAEAAPEARLAGTGDDVLDAMIERLEQSRDPKQIELRSFAELDAGALSARFASIEQDFPGDQFGPGFQRPVSGALQARIDQTGRARLLFTEQCMEDYAGALGIPESYTYNAEAGPDAASPLPSLTDARIYAALKAEGIMPAVLPNLGTRADKPDFLALNDRINALRPPGAVPLVVSEMPGECGAGEIAVRIETNPPGAQLRIIPEFFHTVCTRRKIDASNPAQCRWWRDVVSDFDMVSGTYLYTANTPDGRVRSGRFKVTDAMLANPDGTPAEAIRITI